METDTDKIFPIIKTPFGWYRGYYKGIRLLKGERLKKSRLIEIPMFGELGVNACQMSFHWLGYDGRLFDFPSEVLKQTPQTILKSGANAYYLKYPKMTFVEAEEGVYPPEDCLVEAYFYHYITDEELKLKKGKNKKELDNHSSSKETKKIMKEDEILEQQLNEVVEEKESHQEHDGVQLEMDDFIKQAEHPEQEKNNTTK